MLTILHFPKTRLIWSPSPLDTALIFSSLKENSDEPSPGEALAREAGAQDLTEFYNPQQVDLLLTLPGITSKNVHKLLNSCRNFADVCKKSEAELSRVLQSSESGKLLHQFLHKRLTAADVGPQKKQKIGAYQQYKLNKRKK